jgi:alkylation response protein AidB-like acyl-CoA dehydrogenase
MTSSFSLGEEHNDFRAAVADFAARDLAPHVERWNAAHEAPLEAIKLMADLGLFGLAVRRSTAGQGTSPVCASRSRRSARSTNHSGSRWRLRWDSASTRSLTSAQQSRRRAGYRICGRARAGAFGLTEPEAGSDAGATRTRATDVIMNG